jgi:hypothetical protein
VSKPNNQDVVEITVRDRRQKHQFSVHNRLIDEWLPIITIRGYVLYSFYVRLANREDERSYPGYALIKQHLGMGKSTISEYNQLLEWCELIHIEPGTRVRSNDYYILDVPQVTPERRAKIRQKATTNLIPESKFLAALLKRLDAWKSIQELWGEKKTKGRQVVIHRPEGQMSLPLGDDGVGSPPAEQGSPPAEHPSPSTEQGGSPAEQGSPPGGLEQSEATVEGDESLNDAPRQIAISTASFLQNLGVTEPTLSQIADRDEAVALAWWWYIQTQPGLKKKGLEIDYLIKRLRENDSPLPGYRELAQVWLQLSNEQRWTLLRAEKNHRLYRQPWRLPDDGSTHLPSKQGGAGELAEVFPPLNEAALDALTELAKANVEFGVSEPTPEQINCPGCDQSYWPHEICQDCDRCPDCCTCEPVVEDPALTEAKQIWRDAVTMLEWQGHKNHLIHSLQVIGLDNDELQLGVGNEGARNQLETWANREGLRGRPIDQAISDAAGRPLKARFVLTTDD